MIILGIFSLHTILNRSSFRLVFCCALLAGNLILFYSSPSHSAITSHGSTTVSIPSPLFSVYVDKLGNVTGSDSQIKASHTEPGMFCNKVKEVTAMFSHSRLLYLHSESCKVGGNNGLCNFNENDCSIRIPFPFINVPSQDREVKESYITKCQQLATNGGEIQTQHPFFDKVNMQLSYVNGDHEFNTTQPIVAKVTCEPCPAITLSKNTIEIPVDDMQSINMKQFVAAGSTQITRVELNNVPYGMWFDVNNSVLSGRPINTGSQIAKIRVWSSCRSGKNYFESDFPIVVKGTPPTFSGATAQPPELASTGGNVTLRVNLSHPKAVTSVKAKITAPGNHTAIVSLHLKSGTPQNGTWEVITPISPNTTPARILNTVSFDVDGNLSPANAGTSFAVVGKVPTPPRILTFTVKPEQLEYTGGEVNVSVKASDNTGVQTVTLFFTKPDGTSSGMRLPMVNGTANNGEWGTKWTMNMNPSAALQTYQVRVTVTDNENTSTSSDIKYISVAPHSGGKAGKGTIIKPR